MQLHSAPTRPVFTALDAAAAAAAATTAKLYGSIVLDATAVAAAGAAATRTATTARCNINSSNSCNCRATSAARGFDTVEHVYMLVARGYD